MTRPPCAPQAGLDAGGVHGVQHVNAPLVYLIQLRHKLERDAARPEYRQTELGVGYRLRAE